MSTSRVQETWKYKPLPLPPALPSATSCTLPLALVPTPSTFTSVSVSASASASTSTQHHAPQQRASVCTPITQKTPKTPLSFDPANVLTPVAPLRVRNRYTGRSRTIDPQTTKRARTVIPTHSSLSSNFANSIPCQPLPRFVSSSPLRQPSVTSEDLWNNDEHWKPDIPPSAPHARLSKSSAQISHFPKYSCVNHGPYNREKAISSVTVRSPFSRFPYPHPHQNPNKSAADIYLVTERVDYRTLDTIDDPELSEDEDSGWLFFGKWACAMPAITNLFASTPESTPNMLLLRNLFYEHHLPRAP